MFSMEITRLDFTPYIKEIENISQHSIKTTLNAIKSTWASEAKKRLNGSHKAYVDGLYISHGMGSNGAYAEIGIRANSFANKLEHGFPSYDMKIGFSKSNKRKIGAEGQWYLHVPFRHRTPQAKTSSSMPNELYKQVRKLPQWGRTPSNTGSKSIYNGMVKTPQGETKNSYMTYRTVSQNSPADSWIHPGFKGVSIAGDLESHIPDVFMDVFKSSIGYAHGNNRRQ